ncbi:SSN2 (YDR443C) [Zygosaccharomyces parabailii]|uniref:Mediator of RNA polymerase II transcription subunit 13 n=1 Tax=Zygosaccharomyces bailii (strain CLIB 213 / ATCC 58445 / CBS 680 / BCRC 21525 / NBRC 1098 / NCYC 1416 / NRRL Y-2227) TaxID=1333698 RepID=A0A8J2X8F4_ZYGB2|nr:SSN2 (YDR443C) [Zygosaccharomyces parabailii]CDF89846.1 ZYBA0S05-03092g1_1 [Zygosaccharomyces bailii CLIB 213]CDH17605.1 related to Mediator of RNA polymerase II transcription subunit 13 [Zygosaccharomyces bailii ISA1307]
MATDQSTYNVDDLLSSFYRIEKLEKVNFHQYVPKKQEDQWSIQMELLLRKQNPRNLVALLSRELWCFSINDQEVPTPPRLSGDDNNEVLIPDKKGQFAADYSKPNLPPHYALFLKALRRMIYINITANSFNKLIPYGNACIFLEDSKSCHILLIEPHLFDIGVLATTITTKSPGLIPLTVDRIDDNFLRHHALYLAPSGIRMYLPSGNRQRFLARPPKNAEVLLMTLYVSHGIRLIEKKDLQWVKLIPHLGHLNGHTPNIASYMDSPTDSRTIVWPLDLCFAQKASDVHYDSKDSPCYHDLNDAFDIIEDFVQLKQTSAYRTPKSSNGALGSGLAGNSLSSGGGYTEQFQHYYRSQVGSAPSTSYLLSKENSDPKALSRDISPAYLSFDKPLSGSGENFGSGAFSTTPNLNESELFNDKKSLINDSEVSPVKSEVGSNLKHMLREGEAGTASTMTSPNQVISPSHSTGAITDSPGNEELFGDEDDDEDLFGDSNNYSGGENKSPHGTYIHKSKSDEITDDMFGMSEDEDQDRRSNSNENMYFFKDGRTSAMEPSLKKPSIKRKYLDIPIEEMTLSHTPLYTDPGAPLPIETPREKRKSVFAPLNFNPIIESNVDNKYKNGGKFSISPSHNDEALIFDISTADSSSSEEESDSSDDLEGLNIRQDMRSTDLTEQDAPFGGSISNFQPAVPQAFVRSELMSASLPRANDIMKDGANGIWKISHPDMSQQDPLLSTVNDNMVAADGSLAKMGTTTEQYPNSNKLQKDEPPSGLSENETSIPEPAAADTSLMPESSSSLPFLLRHMPLSSIPDVFFCSKATASITKKNQDILGLLAEQIVFDCGMFDSFGGQEVAYSALKDCENGLIFNTLQELFSEFTRIKGDDIISKIYRMSEPAIHVKRHHEVIKMNADSQVFSQYLDVKPAKGIKNFRFLMLTTSFFHECSSFVSTLSQTYINFEFGFCELLKLTNEDAQGLNFLKDFDESKLLLLAAQIVSYCSTNKNAGNNVPVMIILPIDSDGLEEIVTKTTKFEIIRNEVLSKIPNAQLFLKLILMDFVRNPLIPVDAYSNLCLSIYNILPPKTLKFTSIARTPPKKITFRTMQQSNSSSAIHYDAFIHLAYARSIDKEWVFAAFSDSTGNENIIKTLFVGKSRTKFDEACNEIWATALRLAGRKYGKICLILTRLNGVLPDDELMNWRRLSGRAVHLAVVCVDDNTKISFVDKDPSYPTFKLLLHHIGMEKTLHNSNFDDYEIRNIYEDVHGVIFRNSFPLSNSQHRCAIKSGALVRYKNCSGEQILDKFEVNLLNCPHSDSTKLLETILEEFRNLSALNSWFGISNGDVTHIPWHVLAVKKMMKNLVHTRVKILE